MLITVVLFSSSSSVVFLQAAWIIIKRNAEYKPLQFLAFAFVYRIFEKLKAFEPPASPTYSVSPILCDNICRDFLEIYVWAVLHYRFTLNVFKLVLLAGRRWRFRARTANGKTPASFSCTSFRLYCCFISGMIFNATSVHYVVDGSKCQKPKYCGFSNN